MGGTTVNRHLTGFLHTRQAQPSYGNNLRKENASQEKCWMTFSIKTNDMAADLEISMSIVFCFFFVSWALTAPSSRMSLTSAFNCAK